MLDSKTRKVIEQGGYPPLQEGISLQTKDRRVMSMISYEELFQLLIFIVALIGLCYKVLRDEKK